MEVNQFIQTLGQAAKDAILFNLGLVLYKKESDLMKVTQAFTDSNQITTVAVSAAFDSSALTQIGQALTGRRTVKVLVDGGVNADFFALINYLVRAGQIKFDNLEQAVPVGAKMFLCMKATDFDKAPADFGNIFYPILRV